MRYIYRACTWVWGGMVGFKSNSIVITRTQEPRETVKGMTRQEPVGRTRQDNGGFLIRTRAEVGVLELSHARKELELFLKARL